MGRVVAHPEYVSNDGRHAAGSPQLPTETERFAPRASKARSLGWWAAAKRGRGRLTRAGRRGDQRVPATCDERPAARLRLGRPLGKAAGEPRANGRVKPGQRLRLTVQLTRRRKWRRRLDHLVIVPPAWH